MEKAYKNVLHLRGYIQNTDRAKAQVELKTSLEKTKGLAIKEFNNIANIINDKMETILNYLVHRNTNANAKSLNAKIKLFRANLRGVADTSFFLFRMEKLFA